MSEELPDMTPIAEVPAVEVGVPFRAEGGVEGLQEISAPESVEQTDPVLLDNLFEAVNAKEPTQDQLDLLFANTEIDGMGLSAWADRRRQAQVGTPVNEDVVETASESEPTIEDGVLEQEQGPTPEEIEQMVEEETQRLIAEKIEELADVFLNYSDEDMESIAVRGVPVSGERVLVSGISLEPSLVKSILETLRDHKDLQALVEQIYGDLKQEARENVMNEIAREQSVQEDRSTTVDVAEEASVEEVPVVEPAQEIVPDGVQPVTQNSSAITPTPDV